MKFSVNNKLILEPYTKEGLRKEVVNGIAIPGQKDALKGLKLLMPATLSDGRHIPAGSIAYIREETLHTFDWASKPRSCATIPGKLIIGELQFVEFFETLEGESA